MNRYLLVLAVFVFASPAFTWGGDLLSPEAADRLGMVESWHRQTGTVGGASSIVDMQIWVEHTKEREYIEVVRAVTVGKQVTDADVLRRIATDSKNEYGVELGAKEANRLANLDVLKLKRRGIEAVARSNKVKQVRLYMLGSDGGLWAYDAETGEVLWYVRLGKPKLGYGTLGISDQYVTVINGTTMYRVIADERAAENSVMPAGRPIAPVRLDNIPLIGAVNTSDYVIIPNTRNGLECYNYEDEPGQPALEIFHGQALAKPSRFPTSSLIGWATDQGKMYVMETEGKPTTLFRLQIDGNADGGVAAASDGRFFLGSTAGRVYGVKATRSGEVLWNRSFGEPFYQAPFVTGDSVLIASSYGNLYSLGQTDGIPNWASPVPNIDSIFAQAGPYYFGRTTAGLLTILSPESGQTISTGGSVFVDRIVSNPETDRIYLVSGGGTVQCLRPAGAEMPTFYRDLAAPTAAAGSKEKMKPAEKPASNPFGVAEDSEMAEPAGAADPFGAAPGADPFGADAGADPGADPFGAGAGGDAGEMADPFGASDPFGN